MQLDSTRIAIRERSFLETLDLALHVTRDYALPLLVAFWSIVLPLLLLNYALIGGMAHTDPALVEEDEELPPNFFSRIYGPPSNTRYYWSLALLTFLETPLLSVPIVGFLGPTVFKQPASLRQVLGDVFRFLPHLSWTLLILRGIVPVWLLYLLVDHNDYFSVTEGLFVPAIALLAVTFRAVRPYIVEIILLERNPLFGKSAPMTMGARSALLHGPSSGDLFAWFLGSAAIALLLSLMLVIATYSLCGALVGDWEATSIKVLWLYPIALWHVAGFFAVVGFLGYLNLRIRHEGWEVELLMKAEAVRLASRWN